METVKAIKSHENVQVVHMYLSNNEKQKQVYGRMNTTDTNPNARVHSKMGCAVPNMQSL